MEKVIMVVEELKKHLLKLDQPGLRENERIFNPQIAYL